MFSVYVIYSKKLDVFYKGFSENVTNCLEAHLLGKSKYTSQTDDWTLVYKNEFETKKEALIEEKRLKKLNRLSLEKLINV